MRMGMGLGIKPSQITAATEFISTWYTGHTGESENDEILLPLIDSGTYDFTVAWGDGTANHITAHDDAAITHTYPSSGTYTVKIDGTIEGWQFNNAGDHLKITDISQWGNLIVGTDEGKYFYSCSNLDVSATDVLDLSNVTNMYRAFIYCDSLTTLNVGSWDVSNVYDMSLAFYSCDVMTSATMGGVKNWTITDLTEADNLMNYCTNSMSTPDYSELLIRWEDQPHEDDVTIHFNNATINSNFTLEGFDKTAGEARDALLADGWVITDSGGEHQLILDAVSGSVAAYSTRLLRADYSGYAVEVRNDSNEEIDIGFTDGELDESALLAHADGGDAFVVTWYDQSGEGNDAEQSTAANQPQIVDGGVVITENGKPALDYGSTGNKTINFSTISDIESVFAVLTPINFSSDTFILGDASMSYYHDGSGGMWLHSNAGVVGGGANYINDGNSIDFSTTQRTAGQKIISMIHTGDAQASRISKDRTHAGRSWKGTYQELIIFDVEQSANRTEIRDNINDYYEVY